MGVGLFYSAGDEFGDYAEISYGFDAGPGSIGLSTEITKTQVLTM